MNARRDPKKRATALIVMFTILGVVAPTSAFADAGSDAQDLFVRARELRADGKCADAIPLFRKANDLAPTRLGSLRNIAECEELVGHYASARRAWLELGRGLLVTKDTLKYDGWAKDAESAAARLKPLVAALRVDVIVARATGDGPAQPDDGTVLVLNGETVPQALYGTVLDRDPGEVTIVAKAPNASPVRQVVALTAGSSREVRLRLDLRAPAEPPPPEPAPVTSPTRLVGFVSLGVGVASLAAAGITLGLRQAALADLEEQCPGYESGPCPTSVGGVVSRGETASLMTTVFGIAGATFAATGLVLVLSGASTPKGATGNGAPRLALAPTPGGAHLTWRFR